jgi:acyl carrier protein
MTDPADVLARVRGVFVEFFDDEEIVLEPSSTADEVEGWDSLATVELMIELEREFGIRFSTGEMAALRNVGELIDRIARDLDR